MTGEDLIDSMEFVDSKLVESAETPMPLEKKVWRRVTAVAACLAILVGIGIVFPKRYVRLPLFAESIGEIFVQENTLCDEEESYGMTVRQGQPLWLNPLPDSGTALIYHRNDRKILESEAQERKWSGPILDRLRQNLGGGVEGYDVSAGCDGALGLYYYVCVEPSRRQQGQPELRLGGELVTVDPRQSDAEILASLESIQQKLWDIFDVDFSDARVIRYGEEYVDVLFFDEYAHPLNRIKQRPVTDCIELSFNREDYQGVVSSADERITAKIRYIHYRRNLYQIIGNGKLLSLEEAEKMLAKGYVFGKKCSLCEAADSEEGCTHYDYVSFDYFGDRDRKGLNLVIPVYAFYKKTGESDGGVTSYNITYVCALEVWGLEAYFEDQKDG